MHSGLLGTSIVLAVTMSASAGTGRNNGDPELQRTEACIRAAGQAIASLEKANGYKEAALVFVERAAARPPKPSVSPIFAVFLPKKLATKYTLHVGSNSGGAGPTFRRTLTLKQIDPDKSSPEGFQSVNPRAPNYASAAFDAKYNNRELTGGLQTTTIAGTAVYV